MTTLKQTIIWSILIFIALTLLTMKQEATSDGINSFGFPLTFYNDFSGKCDNCYGKYGFKLLYFLADIGLITVFTFFALRLKNKVFVKIIFVVTMLALTSCKSHCDCETINRKTKDGEALYKICNYIVDNKQITKPANPCEWTIRETKSDTLNGKQITRMTLSCCYMGDQAIIDRKTNEVIGYIPSDK